MSNRRWMVLFVITVAAAIGACKDEGSDGAGGAGTAGGAVAGTGVAGATAGIGASGASGASGAGGTGGASGMGGGDPLALTSSAVQDGQMIPAEHRCEGPSPALAWTGGPAGTMSYAILFKDTTAGGFSEGYVHWVIYDIPASTTSLPEMVPIGYMPAMPSGAHQGPIWNDVVGFNGPCAPFGMNTYQFTLYALDVAMLPEVTMTSTAEQIETQLAAHDLATATLDITSMP